MLYVLDTNVIINQSRRDPKAAAAIEEWVRAGDTLAISTIVEAELLSWPRLTPQKEKLLNDVIASMTVIPVDSRIARTAAVIRRSYRTHLPDALVAATAFLLNAPLVTRNTRDFKRIKELELVEV